ncbi:MAG: DUF2799 domain-containing protein [Pseudomonadota bacterium]
MIRRLFALTTCAIVAGCAGMSAEECQLADWETIGYEDGAAGASGDAIARHRRACAKAGVAPDRVAYEAGRSEGLVAYCQPANGYAVGADGHTYRGVCAASLEGPFLAAYHQGREYYRLRSNVSTLLSRLNFQHRAIQEQRDDIVAIEQDLISAEVTPEDRVALLVDLKEASRSLGEMENEVIELERDLAVAETELEAWESNSYSARAW